MKRTSRMNKRLLLGALLLGISLHPFALPGDARAVNVNIVSDAADPLWTVSDTNGNPLGSPQNVCLNATAPPNCPGATKYGFPGDWWTADLSSIPGAKWIWAPNITGETSPAANAEFTFEHMFYVCGTPQSGTISVTADDSAKVFLNGSSTPVLTTSGPPNSLSTVNIPANSIPQGLNIITVKAKNAYLDWCVTTDNYQCNPAGMVFGASFADSLSALPTCTGNNGKTFTAGQVETLSCPPGKTGSVYRLCTCVGSNGFWITLPNTCTVPPATCTGTDGKTYDVNTSEALPCPTPKVGSASRTCIAKDTWGTPNYSTCTTPPPTCAATNGTTVSVGTTEDRPCTAPKVGFDTFTCGPNGNWDLTSSTCSLPQVGVGDKCWDYDRAVNGQDPDIAVCPSGTECKKHRRCSEDCFLWIFCSTTCLQSVDSFCDP